MKYYGKNSDDIGKLLKTDFSCGLTDKEAKRRLSHYGKNIIFDVRREPASKAVIKLLYDPVSLLLLLSAVICFSYSSYSAAILIFSVWLISNTVTILSYYKAESILNTVKSYGIPKVKVLRDSRIYMIDSRLLVPGDVILVESGDIICADCKILSAHQLYAYEYDLCGTTEVQKKYVSDDENAVGLSEMHGMLFASSSIVSGYGVAVVVNCADNTEIVTIAGYIPISGKHYPELFFKVKKECRSWGLITTFCALMLFLIKVLISGAGIFDTFLLIVALMGASMTEALLPLSQTLAAREISSAAQTGNGNRVIIKNAGSLELLRDISVFVATEEITVFENMDLLRSLSSKGIKAIICTRRNNAFELATKFGSSVCTNISQLEYAKNTLAVFITESIDDRLTLISQLKDKGETVGVLTTRLDSIRMLSEADVAFTYGKFKYKTNDYSKIRIESLSGKQNQILSRICDVICEENMLSTYRAVECARSIYGSIGAAASYLITTQCTRVLFSVLTLFTPWQFITFTNILICGMIIDLCAVLMFAFLKGISLRDPRAKPKKNGYILSVLNAFVLFFVLSGVSLSAHFLPLGFGPDIGCSISFVGFSVFPAFYAIYISMGKDLKHNAKIACIFLSSVISLLLIVAKLTPIGSVLDLNLGFSVFAFSIFSVLLCFVISFFLLKSGGKK